jgi:hypothetical protein
MAILFLNSWTRFCLNLLTTFLLSDFATNGPDGFTATNAIATAADSSMPAIVKRTDVKKPFWLNECGVFILIGAD